MLGRPSALRSPTFRCDHAQGRSAGGHRLLAGVGNSLQRVSSWNHSFELAGSAEEKTLVSSALNSRTSRALSKVLDAAASARSGPTRCRRAGAAASRWRNHSRHRLPGRGCRSCQQGHQGPPRGQRRGLRHRATPDNVSADRQRSDFQPHHRRAQNKITLSEGVVQQKQFQRLSAVEMAECPTFEAVIVNSDAPLGGIRGSRHAAGGFLRWAVRFCGYH